MTGHTRDMQDPCQPDDDALRKAIIAEFMSISREHLIDQHHERLAARGEAITTKLLEIRALQAAGDRHLTALRETMAALCRTRRDLAALLGEAES